MVLHKPYPPADETKLLIADHDRRGAPTRALPDAHAAFSRMKRAAGEDGIGLIAYFGYRSPARQAELYRQAQDRHGRRGAARWWAPPGYSEHHTGLVFDIGDVACPETDDEPAFEGTPGFRWLHEHASKHGFEMSFPPSNFQGVGYEPWHWRFIGSAPARAVFHPSMMRNICVWSQALVCAAKVRIWP